MADEEQLNILKQGVEVWNAWRKENPGVVVDLRGASFEGASLKGVNLSGAAAAKSNFRESNLANSNLNGAVFTDAIFIRTNLSLADLRNASFLGADLGGTDLLGANICDADLNHTNFRDATLKFANLNRTKLKFAILSDANFNNATLSHADLSSADLSRANFDGSNLDGANLSGTKITFANLTGATLASAIFDRAFLGDTAFANVNLSTALDLETVRHHSPSTIGIDTLYKSGGKIPESFLRGCGVPDSFITQMKSLIGAEEGMQFYSCFISYSGVDEQFARRLHGRLQQEHVRVWFAPEDLHSGQKLHEQIDEAIRVFDKLLIVLSPNSLKSEWVLTELRKARKRERQHGKRKLFPLRLVDYETLRDWECFDADHGQDLATEVREYYIPDFSNWKDHDAFETAFARLLKDLRETDAKAAR